MSTFICGPGYENLRRRQLHCPTCERVTDTVTQDGGYWGFERMCCACGDSWLDGERLERPFRRGWRKERIASHRRLWDMAAHGSGPSFEELFPEFAEEAS